MVTLASLPIHSPGQASGPAKPHRKPPRAHRGRPSADFPAAAQSLGCLYYRPWVVSTLTRGTNYSSGGLDGELGKELPGPFPKGYLSGMVLDSVAMRACLSPRRVDDILCRLPLFKAGRRLLFIQFLQLLGKLTAASAVVPLGYCPSRPLQMWMNSLHLDAKWHRQRRVR